MQTPPTPPGMIALYAKDMATGEFVAWEAVPPKDLASREVSLKAEIKEKYLTSGRDIQVFKMQRV